MHEVEIRDARLAYYVAEDALEQGAVIPVWDISGLAHGVDAQGEERQAELRWLEPAVPGHGLPGLGVEPVRAAGSR